MTAVPYRKVDRNLVYEEIVRLINKSGNDEVEISSSELADKFNVQAPTMDYHLSKLIENGLLSVSAKRGRYNRKIYRLPFQEKTEVVKKPEIVTPASEKKFQEFLAEHLKASKVPEESLSINQEQEEGFEKEMPAVQESLPVSEDTHKEMTLDENITRFLNDSNQVHDANVLLKHEDKEILSVVNETIQQTVVYLKDLTEQLSTFQNKQLIQALIDDRNRLLSKNEQLEEDVKAARMQITRTESNELDPSRVRFMHQMIISTIDDYINLPNHALALGRPEFRTKATKEVADLVKYVLKLEK